MQRTYSTMLPSRGKEAKDWIGKVLVGIPRLTPLTRRAFEALATKGLDRKSYEQLPLQLQLQPYTPSPLSVI